ncbi:hypothetical protein [Singulisphaera sp. PoT]|uniref:hypothetical protein n=1 Tax=Singulisphaera sp. PoT TaxID=3411797 RepID=UPI003BF4C306
MTAKSARPRPDRALVPHPCNTDRAYEDDEREFIAAMADYQARTGKRFPTLSETLAVLKSLGYRR